MYTPIYTKQFEKDLKRSRRRGKDIEKFKILARTLIAGENVGENSGNCRGKQLDNDS